MKEKDFDNEFKVKKLEEKDESMDKSDNANISYKIVNIVSTVVTDIDKKINLKQIAQSQSDVEYNPDKFPGLVMRIRKPKGTALIFSTGRMVITGLREETDVDKVVKKVIKNIRKVGFNVKKPIITIQNIVATGNLNINIDLDKAAIVSENTMYEPEIFPGLIYRMQDPKTVFLIFSTGKIVCLGAKKKSTIKKAILTLNKQVYEFGVARKDLDLNVYEDISFI